jgi:hypothetical protein
LRLQAGWLGWPGAVEIYDGVAGLGDTGRKEMKLTGRVHASARGERESVQDGRLKPKRKTYFERTPRARGADGPVKWGGDL